VNAGHNAPILFASGAVSFLEATGVPLGLFPGAEYQARTAVVPRGGALLLFTDGLTDSIPGTRPEDRLRDALKGDPATTMSNLKSSVDPKFNEDDVTILLVRRRQDAAPSGA
jgi:serine phosphatase RsbU (regulator of sigma subunit)